MLHKFGAKILCMDASDIAFATCVDAFGDHALVLRLTAQKDGTFTLSQTDGSTETLVNPLLGPTVIVCFAEKTAKSTHVVAVRKVWEDARQPLPTLVNVFKEAGDLAGVQQELLAIQSGLVTDAMQRNVDLLKQVAALRLLSENLNTVVSGLRDILIRNQGGAHRLLYEGKPWGDKIEVKPGQTLRQRFPVSVMPSLIGAVSFEVSGAANCNVKVTMFAVDHDEIIATKISTLPSGKHMIFLPIQTEISPNFRFIDIVIENTGITDITLDGALQESPEEGVRFDGDTSDDQDVRSILFCVWTPGPGKSTVHELSSTRRLVPSLDVWRNGAEKATPGFEQRDWVSKRGPDGLMVHPLPNTAAVACCPLKAREGPFVGARMGFSLPEKASCSVKARLIITQQQTKFENTADALIFANATTTNGEIARSDWLTVAPGTSRPAIVFANVNMAEGFLNIAVVANDHDIAFGHFIASGLELVVE